MRKYAFCFIYALIHLTFIPSLCQTRVTAGFYNVENLFDTIPSLFYDDTDYTSDGRFKWDSEKYSTKIINLSRVIDSMALDIIGLAEVENENVVRDLVSELNTDYNYVHFTSGDYRGIDLAFLYKGDKFLVEKARLLKSGTGREFLHINGLWYGIPVDILLCHLPSRMNPDHLRKRVLEKLKTTSDSLITNCSGRLLLMGDFNAPVSDKFMRRYIKTSLPIENRHALIPVLHKDEKAGRGTYNYKGKWQLIDNIFISPELLYGKLRYHSAGIFIRDFMLTHSAKDRSRVPFRTYSGGKYTAGYSDHLPVYIVFNIIDD